VEFLRSRRTTTQVSLSHSLFPIPGSQLPFDRPVIWTSFAILFAHKIEPAIVGRAFPSSRQFRLQSPAVVTNTPDAYEPPTILCVSPSEDWLFAYFPGRQIPGVGCFWRAQQADGWDIVEFISFPRGKGVVSAKWLGHAREVCPDTLTPSKPSFTCATVGCRHRPEYIEASSTRTRSVGLLAYPCTSNAEPPGTALLRSIWAPTARNSDCILLSPRKT
jgi:hypothetical protein